MSEGIITGTIYETRLRDKNCCLRYGKKKKKKNTKCTRRVTEDQLSVALYKHSKTSNTSKSL